MATASAASPSHLLLSSSRPLSQLCIFGSRKFLSFAIPSCSNGTGISKSKRRHAAAGIRCLAVDASPVATEKKSSYDLQTLTTWLLKQEQAGHIDAELAIVLSSISMACKQIASLVQRAGISNLTGVQGAVNVQGEDQKKLDVVSNEVCNLEFQILCSCS